MELKINVNYIVPKQMRDESAFDRNRRIGARMISTAGRIGNGTKVHRFTLEVVDTDNGLGIVSVWSVCGSAKWNSYLAPHFDDNLECNCKRCLPPKPKQEEVKMANVKSVTVKQLKTACDLINEHGALRPDNDPIRLGKKATKPAIIKVFLAAMVYIDGAGKLDEVPADAWDVYQAVKPAAVEESAGVNYNDTPEAKAVKKAAKEAAKATKEAKAADKPKKFTKAMAFWKCLTDNPVTNKKALAEMLRTNHGNGSEAEAKFWTNNYLNLLVETGLVEVKGQAVTLIER